MIFPPFIVSLDIGQSHDPTALAILERRIVQLGAAIHQEYHNRFLLRFPLGTPYPDIAEEVSGLLKQLPRPPAWQEDVRRLQRDAPSHRLPPEPPRHVFIIDNTGVGRPVGDMFARLSMRTLRIMITGGTQVTNPVRDEYHVPKSALIGAFQVALQTYRFKAAEGMPEVLTLIQEARDFQYKIKSTASEDPYLVWRSGAHDDLLLAVCMGVWYGETHAPPPPRGLKPPASKRLHVRTRTNV